MRIRLHGAVNGVVRIYLRVVEGLQPRHAFWCRTIVDVRLEMSNVRHLFSLEDIEGDAEAGSTDRRRIGDVDANKSGIAQVDLLAHETVIVGADHRHVFEVRGLESIDDGFVNA